ncbi:acetyl-CoA C-acyltransferase [Nakamurella sp. YIM 132087]|uniref:Acetyl-CoA C-acyltransferase n=1 Tax=Nakamurella alba TaxID=2665158 RepID=A0A7K1FEX6_9ACTN|nr:thiolase family protein [Nakamurella alba]MTD12661.1 acetyl-CoA C-acyltransferase [Nakamurella alba]
MAHAVIVDAVRTASGKGKMGGSLSGLHPVDLLAQTIKGLVDRSGIDPAVIDDVIAGCVGQAGEQSFNIARNAALAAGLPVEVPGTSVDRQCGSSQQAAHFAAQGVIAGAYDVVIAGGVESMSRVPMGSHSMGKDPFGPMMHARFAADPLVPQGISAELIAAQWKFDREDLDSYAARSHQRAAATAAAGGFAREILPLPVTAADGSQVTFAADETVRASTTVEGLAGLKPAFQTEEYAQRFPQIGWHITPGNSSPFTDGASAVLIMSEQRAKELGLTPRARFHSFAVTGDDPLMMLTGPIPATRKILGRSGLSIDDLDAYEVNEAFASVPLAWQQEFGADPEKLNPRGGAIALGHPLGASGTKLLTTMLHHLEDTGGRYGLQTMCEGGGMANALILERL